MSESFNPYRPPESTPEKAIIDPARGFANGEWTSSGRVTFGLIMVAMIAYITFTLMLLGSTAGDRKAGILFCGNLPVFVIWVMLLVRKSRSSHYCGVAAALVQVGVLFGMLLQDIGDVDAVTTINLLIAGGFVALALLSYGNISRHMVASSNALRVD